MKPRLRHLLAAAFIFIATVPLLILGSWVQKTAMEKELAAVSEKHLLLAQNITAALDRYALDTKAAFAFFAQSAGPDRPSAATDELARSLGFRQFSIIDDEGRVSFRLNLGEEIGDRLPAPTLNRLRPAFDNPDVTFSNVMPDAKGQPTIFLTHRLGPGRIAIGALDLGYIRQVQKAIAFGRKGHSAIVDGAGTLIAHPRPQWQRQMKNIAKVKPVAKMMAGETGVTQFYSPAVKKDMITGFTTVPSTGWGVMVPQPLEELEERANDVRRIALALVVFGLLVATVLSWLLSGLLVRPVEAVIKTARDIADGNLESRVPHPSRFAPTEFLKLGTVFNAMARDVATVMIQRQRVEKELRQAHDELETRVEERTRALTEEIAEREQAEKLLERQKTLFEAVFRDVPDAMVLTDTDRAILMCNPGFTRTFGYEADEVLGQKTETLYESREEFERQGRLRFNLSAVEKLEPYVVNYKRQDGEVFPGETVGTAIRDKDGTTLGFIGVIRDITERQRAEKLQQGRNEVLERLATGGSLEEVLTLLITTAEEISPDMRGSVLLLDEDGTHLVNGAAPNLPDFYNEAVDGIEIADGAGCCGTAAFRGEVIIVDDIMSHPHWTAFRDVAAKANLAACWSQPIISAAGKVLGTFAMYYGEPRQPTPADIEIIETSAQLAAIAIERKQMEDALSKSGQRLRGAINSLQEGFALFDADDRLVALNEEYLRVSPAAGEILEKGGTFEDTIKANIARGVLVEAIGREEAFLEERLEQHKNPKGPLIRRFTDGSWYMISEVKTPEGGTALSFIDITELKEAEEALKEGRKRFKDFAEVASDWFWEMDENLRFSYFSGRNFQVTGFSRDDLIGKTRREVTKENLQDEKWRKHFADLDAHRPFQDFWYDLTTPDGHSLSISISGTPIFDGDGNFKGYRGTGTDISAQVTAEEKLRDARDEAEYANRAKTEFLANMSHELRTPLNSVIGFSEVLMAESFGPIENPKVREYVTDINESGLHLLQLINDILDVARIERGLLDLNEKKLDVPLLVASCQRLVNDRAFDAGLELTADVAKSLPALLADELRIKQILLNLLSNAIKFTPEGGKVSLRVAIDSENRFQLSVSDTGIGIAPENIDRALSDFGQVDSSLTRKHDGAGLGLPLSKKLTELHGGELFIESELGAGTLVTILFPKDRTIPLS